MSEIIKKVFVDFSIMQYSKEMEKTDQRRLKKMTQCFSECTKLERIFDIIFFKLENRLLNKRD